QQCQQLAVSCRLVLAHLGNCRWTAVSEVSEQGCNKLAVQLLTVTRADRTAGRVSRPPSTRIPSNTAGCAWRAPRSGTRWLFWRPSTGPTMASYCALETKTLAPSLGLLVSCLPITDPSELLPPSLIPST